MTSILSHGAIMLSIVVIGLVLAAFPAMSADSEISMKNNTEDLETIGIVNPDGLKSVWLIPRTDSYSILILLAKFPSQIIEGLKFYTLSSWKDTTRFLTAVNEQQARAIRRLAQNMRQLNKRIGNLEKKRKRRSYSGSMDRRLSALEDKVDSMSDGGLR